MTLQVFSVWTNRVYLSGDRRLGNKFHVKQIPCAGDSVVREGRKKLVSVSRRAAAGPSVFQS
jgi:hypothetical protein